jgi:hypothetical protein
MVKQNYTAEQIIVRLRGQRLLCFGQNGEGEVRSIGVSERTYCRWRKKYGGMSSIDVKRLWELKRKTPV